MKVIDLTGMVFGRLSILGREVNDKNGKARWRARCSCGKEIVTLSNDLVRGKSKSCGCVTREAVIARNKTDKQKSKAGSGERLKNKALRPYSKTRTYGVWKGMIRRCVESHHYGGRGITVCNEWKDSFEAFLQDMGHVPDGMQIDRIDNDWNYEKQNCHWVFPTQNNRNKRTTRYMMVGGEKIMARDAAKRLNIPYQTVIYRLNNGWTDEEALTVK